MSDRQFCVVTSDMSGFGFAQLLLREGEKVVLVGQPAPDEEDVAGFNLVGKGLVSRVPLAAARQMFKNAHWIFDTNALSDVSEQLRSEGRKVFGASALSEQMEHDRHFAVEVAQQAGLSIPETEEFQAVDEGIAFLEAHADEAYCFKPNEMGASWLTFVPDHEADPDANLELQAYLRYLTDGLKDGYILQARKKGVEVAVEIWCYEGEPFLATCDLESKRKLNRDLGPHCGCSQNVVWVLPLESRLVRETVGRLGPWLLEQKYTGFCDVNVILAERDVWFLEAGFRFPYSAGPNLFMSLALDGFGDIMAAFIDGDVANFESHFRRGFGASVNLYLDHPRKGLPLTVKDWAVPHYYAYDCYKEGDDGLFLAGYSPDLGVYAEADFTIAQAAEKCVTKLYVEEAVSVPDVGFRTDLGRTDYPSSAVRRFEALQAMRFL